MTCRSRTASRMFIRTFSYGNFLSVSSTTSDANYILDKVRILSTRGHLTDALSLFYNSPPSLRSEQTYAALFHACAVHGHIAEGLNLHQHLIECNGNNPPDLFVTNHLIHMYCKFGHLDHAHKLFEEMPKRNLVSWTALISGYSQNGYAKECFHLFSDLLVHYRPNEFTFASVISSCDYLEGKQAHGLSLKMSLDASVYVNNALINMYNNNYGCDNGVQDEAQMVFDGMRFRNAISWNSMIAGLQLRKLKVRAIEHFSKMRHEGIEVNRVTILSVLTSLCGNYDMENYLALKLCFQLHCLCIKNGFTLRTEVVTNLVKVYSELGAELSKCKRLFLENNYYRDIVSWTGIMTALAEREPEEALFLFRRLLREGLSPDLHVFSIVLKSCAGLVTERHALAVHSQVIKSGFEGDMVLSNALIHAYARCGAIALSKKVFDEMEYHDLVSWNSMIKAYALHGLAKEALELFSTMNLLPDSATFVALLSACSHAGMVEEGNKLFELMIGNHGIVPQLDHYACMVDILGRGGCILEAEKLISEMPMEPDAVIWSALLGSCRKHGETELAELAARKLMELKPEESLGYIQMSNIYCSSGSFNRAGFIRKEMSDSRVRKEPGLSRIEIGNQVHEFASGGNRHPDIEAIRAKLEGFIGQLKEIGYVPETSIALHDIEEEHKEEQLYNHSEKLALVFAIMNQKSLPSGQSVIRIMKNIRICVDCHNFMKLASDLLQNEIIVRDSNRFHHFRDRTCSCNDYW